MIGSGEWNYGKCRRHRRGFTLIELLVVVAIIALLISILLPSLNGARKQARASRCGANLRSVGQAFGIYLAENRACYPPSYIYASDRMGGYDLEDQPIDPSTSGYIHWSWFLFNHGAVKDEAFQCPEFPHGGLPRTDPGPLQQNWESGQLDESGSGWYAGTSLEDKQAARMAYTANAAVVPRNKFTVDMSGGNRVNKLVQEGAVVEPQGVILAGEFNNNWRTITGNPGSGSPGANPNFCKSHRPVLAFFSQSSGSRVYEAPLNWNSFQYGDPAAPNYGLLSMTDLQNRSGVIDDPSIPTVNAIGRHHPGSDKLGGMSNFLFTDGHVDRTTILATMKKRQWGNKFYSLSGAHTDVGYVENANNGE